MGQHVLKLGCCGLRPLVEIAVPGGAAEIEAPAAADPEDVTRSKLREQVDFILSTDEDALKAMHSTIGRPAFSAIHAFWLGNLRGTSGDSDFDERAKSAATKL
ncbi:MAG: hypothetical protein AAFV09_18340, partial [Pseudomonadota bacterium]